MLSQTVNLCSIIKAHQKVAVLLHQQINGVKIQVFECCLSSAAIYVSSQSRCLLSVQLFDYKVIN